MRSSQKYNTKLRPRMIDAFCQNRARALSASELHAILCGQGEAVNLVTVYRNLERMTDEGVLIRFYKNGEHGGALYKYSGEAGECHCHIHAKCTECGEILHLDCDFMEELVRHTEDEHGFSILMGNTVLSGMCSECKSKQNSKKEHTDI